MPELVKQRLPATNLDRASEQELTVLLNAIVDGVRAIAAKLDADATVTDTNYAATLDAIVTK
jgi:hypothetical protein